MNILVAGAGIGGLTAALCLLKAGHEVQVFEQASEWLEVGAGVQLGANALCVLDALGLMQSIQALAVRPERVEFREFDSGRVLHSEQWGDVYEAEYGLPYLHIHRADLQRVLVDAVNSISRSTIHLNSCVESYTESAAGVELKLFDGRIFSGDCLVAADGVKSRIRQQLFNGVMPQAQFSGYVAWRGTIPRGELPDDFMPTIATNFVGEQKHMVMYYLRNQELINFVGVVKKRAASKQLSLSSQSWQTKSSRQQLQADFVNWHPMVQELISRVNPEQCFQWDLYDHKPSKSWCSVRVALLGDAAHACLPYMASGAAMAIEDGQVLSRSLSEKASLSQALACYQAQRIERTEKIQNMSRQAGQLYHLPYRLLQRSAFKLLALRPASVRGWLPSYNANTLKL